MRALHIVTAFPRHEGDVITPWLGNVLLGLREAGVEPEVLAPSYRGGGAREWRGIRVHRFRYAPAAFETLTHDETVPDRLRRQPWYASLLPGYVVGGALAAYRAGHTAPDVIHVHWPVPHGLFGAVGRVASGDRSALVASYYSVELRWIERRLPSLVPLLRWTIASADEVTAISTATAREVRRYVDRPVRIIPFATGLSVEAPAVARRGNSPAGAAEILFVGRLVERKGVEVLVRALAHLRRRREARLTIVGEGEWEPRIRAAARAAGVASAVTFTGRIDESALVEAYERASVFALPAVRDAKGDTEGLGVVLLEALSFGVPVVASDAGGIPDIIVDGETGWLVPPRDAGALARALEEALDDPEEALRRVADGRERAERRFSPEGIVASLVECYEAAVARRRGRV